MPRAISPRHTSDTLRVVEVFGVDHTAGVARPATPRVSPSNTPQIPWYPRCVDRRYHQTRLTNFQQGETSGCLAPLPARNPPPAPCRHAQVLVNLQARGESQGRGQQLALDKSTLLAFDAGAQTPAGTQPAPPPRSQDQPARCMAPSCQQINIGVPKLCCSAAS